MNQRSESREEYLEAIFKSAQSPEGATVTRLAEELGLATASVSQMVARLSSEGLVRRDEAHRVVLTDEGRAAAIRLVRRHRLSERFLTDYLDLPWDQVHEEACKLEHVLSDEVEARLAAQLGNPQTCPHGRAIPGEDGELASEEASSPSSPGMARPWGQVWGLPSCAARRASTSSLSTCSSLQASSWTWSQGRSR